MKLQNIINKWQKETERIDKEIVQSNTFLESSKNTVKIMNDKIKEILKELRQIN